MNTEEIEKALIQRTVLDAVAEVLDVNMTEISSQTKLQDDLGADSIDFVDILVRIEETFNTEFPITMCETQRLSPSMTSPHSSITT